MASDLLSAICAEIDDRLGELRPLLAEYEQLLVAAEALETTSRSSGSAVTAQVPVKRAGVRGRRRTGGRGSAAGAIELAASTATGDVITKARESTPRGSSDEADALSGIDSSSSLRSADKSKGSLRAARGAAREAILAALDHGSHTLSELVVVTAMSAPNISGNLRRLLSEGSIIKTEREGKTAWALAVAPV